MAFKAMHVFKKKMNTKEQVISGLRETFIKVGQVSYREVWEQVHIYQNDIKKYFGTLKNACKELEIPITKRKNKIVYCIQCKKELEISKHSINNFERFCNECKIKNNNKSFDNLVENYDYLVCPACGFRTKSLEAHFRENNSTWRACKFSKEEVEAKYGILKMFAPITDKKAKEKRKEIGWYRDRDATIRRMRASAGKHFLGKTKENCEYVKRISEKRHFQIVNGLIDLRKYKISKQQLEDTAIEGCINLRISSEKLHIPIWIVSRLCEKYELKVSRKWKTQQYVLETIAGILNTTFVEEFQFKNSKFRYDGCFEAFKLLVEVNGYQHYIFPNIYHRTRDAFEKAQIRDLLKQHEAERREYCFLVIKYDDDISVVSLRDKLSKFMFFESELQA